MKKLFSKSFAALIISTVVFQIPLLAQAKTHFTREIRPANFKPKDLVSDEEIEKFNKVNVKVPKKTRGIERYDKLNVWGEVIPDSCLFFRDLLNQRQKSFYDVAYKTLMNGEKKVAVPVVLTRDEFYDVMESLRYDNPEVYWWAGCYTSWSNYDGTPTDVEFNYLINDSELEDAYEKFMKATSPVLFYAVTLPDEMSKIKYIHDYICLSVEYDYDALEAGQTGGLLQTAYSGAVSYKTVCAGYASLFQFYMQQLGIPCAKIRGDGHAWNFLKVNGQYYQMDVTWNDGYGVPPYYNLKNEEMQSVESHTPEGLSKQIVDSHPSKGNQMTYRQYYGDTPTGSPYTYKELEYFDYERSIYQPITVKVFTDKDTNEIADFQKTDDTDSQTDEIDSQEYEINSQTNVVETLASVYFTLGGGFSTNAQRIAESFTNVSYVEVNNLKEGLFELVLTVKGDSEIRPSLAKKLVDDGFDLYGITYEKVVEDSK